MNMNFNLNSDTSDDSENEEKNKLPNNLKSYLKDDKSRIYDMINMLDIYGRKKKKEELIKDYNTKF